VLIQEAEDMTRLWLAVVATAWGSAALANDARIMIVDDVAGEEGHVTVLPYDGVLPESPHPKLAVPQMPGYPVQMGSQVNFKPARGMAFADLDGDGVLEVIASSTDSRLYAWDATGSPMPGFPVSLIGWAQYAPSVADMDGDGDVEIVQPTRGQTSGGRLYAIDHTGAVLPGFPISMTNDNLSSCATLYDLDDDGVMEIIIGQRDYPIGYIHIVRLDGSEWGGNWPVAIDHVPAATASVGDVDNDGSPEIIYLSYNSIYVLNVDGTVETGWPLQIANAKFSYQSPALADLDDDGDLEIVVGAHQTAAGCYVFHHDGTLYPGWPKLLGTWTYCPPTVTDLEGDGILEILDGRAGFGPGVYSNCFWAWESDGSIKPGFPYAQAHGGGSEGPITVADIDGDGTMEIFTDHNIQDGDGGYLFGVDASGNDLPGFPLRPQGFTYLNGAMIADVDGDGDYELGVLSNEETVTNVNLYDLGETYQVTDRDWPTYHARNERGGLYAPGGDCVGDLDGDGDTDLSDLGILLASYDVDGGGDLDGDGDTDLSDLGILLADYDCGT
jgi:hypothetical protein